MFKLCDKYKIEREYVCDKLINILKLDDKHSFILSELDEDTENKQQFLNMKEVIQKYFAYSEISSFKQDVKCKRPI